MTDVIVSLNELEAMVRKAFRGAGYHWGEAEEGGRAAVWLARRGRPVIAPLLDLLQTVDGKTVTFRPIPEVNGVRSASGSLCPVLTGIAYADGALVMGPDAIRRLPGLLAPDLLEPFLADAAGESMNRTLAVEPAQWSTLNRFAMATYVPASEHSRAAGAGAGLADND